MNHEQRLQLTYYSILLTLGVSGAVFYYLQNHWHGLGGSIALPKVLWLGYALWFWYFLPLMIGSDTRISSKLRRLYWILWLNMVIRAIAELGMMYLGRNWHPYYGISHDLFSALLIFTLLFKEKADVFAGSEQEREFLSSHLEVLNIPSPHLLLTPSSIDKSARFNFRVMGVMFWIEAYFAWYMLQYVHSDKEPVYFVPGNHEHLGIMLVTWVVVIGLTIQQFVFARQWLYEPIERSSHSQTGTPK
jgi:hypothetical protein